MGTRSSGIRAPVPGERRRNEREEQPGLPELGGLGELDVLAQEGLFQTLRQVRKQIADAKGLPAYIVFSDKTLRAMARAQPTDSASLRRCPGVGEAKLEAYGPLFLQAVREFLERSGLT